MTREQADELPCGVYRFNWWEGGQSVGAVGRDSRGQPWFQPANWISGPSYDWRRVKSVELIERSFKDCEG
jgi:hypothetical protein